MAILTKELRNQLSKVVLEARDAAERAAQKVLHTIGVDEPDVPQHLSAVGRLHRRALRAQAKQLGDKEDPRKKGRYDLYHLTEKIAYDQWHRMLFARFLAENDLLIAPRHGVPVSLQECRELAPELGLRDEWDVAVRFAADMLPQIFRPDDPAGKIELAPEDRSALRELVISLPTDVFLADDSLGWVYQFWQAKRKDEVNRLEKKIGADELPAVTQLFTEDYMVLFLLHNTLGAWWAGKQLLKRLELASNAKNEDELRQACALRGYNWTYLRFIREQDNGPWRPAAGTFDDWPKSVTEITVLDPCCGSGHFLVEAFRLLVPMRMAEEGLSAREACDSVLRDNLFGLEIDPRCTQIAAFNLAFAAWVYPNCGGHRALPELHLACSGLGVEAKEEEWLKLAGKDTRLREGMRRLYRLFKDAPMLGSLIDPRREFEASPGELEFDKGRFEELRPLLEQALAREDVKSDAQATEAAIAAQGMAKAALLLGNSYTLVTTNVPYVAWPKQEEGLKEFCLRWFRKSKNDLATVFVDRCHDLTAPGATAALVCPQYWYFLRTYAAMRGEELAKTTLNLIGRLGVGAFETISGEIVNVALHISSTIPPSDAHELSGIDASGLRGVHNKADCLRRNDVSRVRQCRLTLNRDMPIVIDPIVSSATLAAYADCFAGVMNGDSPRFERQIWEIVNRANLWVFEQTTVRETKTFGGLDKLIFYDDQNGHLRLEATTRRERLHNSDERGNQAWGKWGVAVSQMGGLPVSLYFGSKFDSNTAVVLPRDVSHLTAIWCYCSSTRFPKDVRKIDQSLKVTNASLVKGPFDFDYWKSEAERRYSHGPPRPYSDDPTQWIFHGHPCGSVIWDKGKKGTAHGRLRTDETVLQVAVARLLGHRWPVELDPKIELADEQREWVRRCQELQEFADNDGIVCINPIKGEQAAAEKLRALLAVAFGNESSSGKQNESLEQVGYGGKALEDWLRNGFFEQHCQLFHQRPFIWHIWDGRRDGFSALVNYHKLDRGNMEKLTYTFLGDWITRQRVANEAGEEGSDARLQAVLELKSELEKIIEGEAPYDIFVRWKPIEKQPIGWEPDLNDGVRLNIRPFVIAGVLRKNPKINWNKDRGKDVSSAPWYKMFKGERINDHHLTLEEKRKARGKS